MAVQFADPKVIYEFLVPNEMHPIDALPVLSRAPKGAVVAVGTERALFDTLMMHEPTQVIGIDRAEDVVCFHVMNAGLLRAIPTMGIELYVQLRKFPNRQIWNAVFLEALRAGRISPEEYWVLTDDNAFDWWAKNIADLKLWKSLYQPVLNPEAPFAGVDYLHDPNRFAVIESLAKNHHYLAGGIDLSNAAELKSFVKQLKDEGIEISVLDLSNAWQKEGFNDYLGSLNTARVLEEFAPVIHRNGIIIFTQGARINERENPIMVYSGFRFSAVQNYAGSPRNWGEGSYTMEDAISLMGWRTKQLCEKVFLEGNSDKAQFFESLK